MRAFSGCILAVTILFIVVGCASYKKPTHYIHLPEYGYLPVIDDGGTEEIMISYVAYDWYDYEGGAVNNHIGKIGLSPRDFLPQTREEAETIVETNFTLEREQQKSEAFKTALVAPVGIPFMMIYWAPGIALISESYAHNSTNNEKQDSQSSQPSVKTVPNKKGNHGGAAQRLKILILDPQNQPISDAEVLVLVSPVIFEGYADKTGYRTYPKQTTHQFHISSKLAGMMADHLGMEHTPAGKHTDKDGNTEIQIAYSGKIPDGSSLLVLVKRAGYRSKAVRIPFDRIFSNKTTVEISLEKQEGKSIQTIGLNPWTVFRQLEKQVLYYTREYEKLASPYLPALPSLSWSEFEALVRVAEKIVPEYPIVQSARFFYEVKAGRLSEAKKYHQFIKDDVYIQAVHGMRWVTGLRMR